MRFQYCPATVNGSNLQYTTAFGREGEESYDHESGDLPFPSTAQKTYEDRKVLSVTNRLHAHSVVAIGEGFISQYG